MSMYSFIGSPVLLCFVRRRMRRDVMARQLLSPSTTTLRLERWATMDRLVQVCGRP